MSSFLSAKNLNAIFNYFLQSHRVDDVDHFYAKFVEIAELVDDTSPNIPDLDKNGLLLEAAANYMERSLTSLDQKMEEHELSRRAMQPRVPRRPDFENMVVDTSTARLQNPYMLNQVTNLKPERPLHAVHTVYSRVYCVKTRDVTVDLHDVSLLRIHAIEVPRPAYSVTDSCNRLVVNGTEHAIVPGAYAHIDHVLAKVCALVNKNHSRSLRHVYDPTTLKLSLVDDTDDDTVTTIANGPTSVLRVLGFNGDTLLLGKSTGVIHADVSVQWPPPPSNYLVFRCPQLMGKNELTLTYGQNTVDIQKDLSDLRPYVPVMTFEFLNMDGESVAFDTAWPTVCCQVRCTT